MITSTETKRNGLADKFSGYVGTLSQRYARYKTFRVTVDELSGLSDRELADLGIARSMIRSIAYRAAYDG